MPRKLIEHVLVTADGVFEDPGAWGYRDFNEDERYRDGLAEVLSCEAMLFGRRGYESLSLAFSQRTDAWAARITAMKKYIISSTLPQAAWNNATVLHGDAAAAVAKLKQEDGGDLLIYGHTTLAEALWRARLIDVLHLAVNPIIFGSGRRFFREGLNVRLKLLSAKSYSKGPVKLTYVPQY